jgi:hypothetical protein
MSAFCFIPGLVCERTAIAVETTLGKRLQQDKINNGDIQLYIPEFSKPTGKYVSRLLLRLFNASLRKGSLVFAGNPCTPGMSVLEQHMETEARSVLAENNIHTVVCNFSDVPQTTDGIVFQAEPFMCLKLRPEWKSLEDYSRAMQSKYRIRVNKALQCSQHLKSAWFEGSELTDEQIACMANLLSATLAKKTLALPPNLHGLIKGFCKTYGRNYETVFCRDPQGNVMGFLSAVTTGNQVFAMHIGYLAEQAREWHLYQRLMLDLISRNVGKDIHAIQLGRTATEIKSTLGAEPMENSIVVYTRSFLLKSILKAYKQYFFKPKTYVLRRPFRDQ